MQNWIVGLFCPPYSVRAVRDRVVFLVTKVPEVASAAARYWCGLGPGRQVFLHQTWRCAVVAGSGLRAGVFFSAFSASIS